MATQPIGAWRSAAGAHAGMANEPRPMRECVGARHRPGTEVSTDIGPWRKLRRETFGRLCDVKQPRLTTLLDGQAAQARRVNFWRTEQLSRSAKPIKIVRMSPEAKRNTNFLISDFRRILRERSIKLSLEVTRAALNRNLEQPISNAIARAALPGKPPQKSGNVRNLS